MKDLVSIIIPMYNVEKYIPRCLDSILRQTYSNLEILLIDDESTDGSLNVCNEYAKKDKRIKVISKKNGGVSSSRNTGIKEALGEYICFIDSDDYIEDDMIMILYNNLKEYNADVSICSYLDEYDNGKKEVSKHFKEKIVVLDNIAALSNLIMEKNITNHLWNKLCKASLYKDVVFPVGRVMEDLAMTYKVLESSNKIVCDNYIGYHYMHRGNSIMESINEKLALDYEHAVFEKNKYISNKYPELKDATEIENIKTYKRLYYYAILGNFKHVLKSEKYKEYYKKYKKNYFKYRKQIKEIVGKKVVLSFDLFWVSKRLYYLYLKIK